MRFRTFALIAAAFVPSLLLPGQSSAQRVSVQEEIQQMQERLEPDPLRRIFKAMAVQTVALERLATIGQLCRMVSDEDAQAIRRNAAGILEAHKNALHPEDQLWAGTYLEGMRIGATQSGILKEDRDEAGCGRFAQAGGALMRVMTWTDKPQYTKEGLLASPRMIP
ncbi:hypothetical protein JQK15_20075 [Sphingobium sp. BHU LFT2]|uniref:hypothetical protein n=1 Tax=Sphingobium sp. BHU LFT2 TaxID=2807634 RepID=UPI001BE607CA|nr:hypothetical protein [Sphingobium sp. BHU LFT2]MBT2245815.1 hypothetical protein [Sphingobium sp. BHU LFT2]